MLLCKWGFCRKKVASLGDTNYQLPLQTIRKEDTGKVARPKDKIMFLHQKERYICIPNFCKGSCGFFSGYPPNHTHCGRILKK